MRTLLPILAGAAVLALLGAAPGEGMRDADTREPYALVPDTTCSVAIVVRVRHGQPVPADSAARQVTLARLSPAYIKALHFCMEHGGRLPTASAELLAYGRRTPPLTRCALRDGSQLEDEWGTSFRWDRRGASLSVRSAGPDRIFDTKDDLVAPPVAGVPTDTLSVARVCAWRAADSAQAAPAG